MTSICIVCGYEPIKDIETKGYREVFDCPRCGKYALDFGAKTELEGLFGKYEDAPERLSYAIRKMADRTPEPLIKANQLKDILENTKLPSPQEQLENFLLWLGDIQVRPGGKERIKIDSVSRIGASSASGLGFIVLHAMKEGLIEGDVAVSGDVLRAGTRVFLTFNGWALYEQLKRGHGSSNIAFMAMKFNEPDLDEVFGKCFVPAVAQTGFDLRRIIDGQEAGLIDDKLRVAIRQSRFVIADLTHHNNGAYWEAGYAEGLGKPVIYTCRKDIFDDKTKGTHFDTNHHLTVVWEPERLDVAAQRLKDTIRATLPEDSKQED